MSLPLAAVRGLILGEVASWTSVYHRSLLLPYWTRRKRREIAADHDRQGLLELALPFALNQSTAPFRRGPGAHSEWFAFQLDVVARCGGRYDGGVALAAWQGLVAARERGELRLTLAQRAALENLARGKEPPASGHDNPHYFDDSACFRALALAVLGVPDLIAVIAEDASISNAEDGIWAAQAYAAALAAAPEQGVRPSLELGATHIPGDSWAGRLMAVALREAKTAVSLFDLIHRLAVELANDAYDYGNSASETVPIAFAILYFTRGNLAEALLAALALPRTAGSVAPLVAAFCGVLEPAQVEEAKVFGSRLSGVSLSALAGIDLVALLPSGDERVV